MAQSAEQLASQNRSLRARITELEQQLAHAQAQQSATQQALTQRDQELSALHQASLALMNDLNLSAVLKTIITSAAKLIQTSHGFIYLVNKQEDVLETKIGIGFHDGYVGYQLNYGEGLSGRVWQTGQPIIVNDYVNWPGRVTTLHAPFLHAIAAVPLLRNLEVVGVIGLSFDDGRVFDREIVDLLNRFAQLASMVLDNAQFYSAAQHEIAERQQTEAALRQSEQQQRALYLKAQRQAQELDLLGQIRSALAREIDLQAVFRTVVEAVAQVFGYTHVSLYTLEHETLILRHQVGYQSSIERIPITNGVSGRVVRQQQPLLIEDVHSDPDFLGAGEGIFSQICVPLFDKQQAIGVINVESSNGVRLSTDDLNLIVSLAEHVSIAINRAWLFSAVQHRVQELEALHTTITEISANLNLDTLLRAILERQVALLGATTGELALYDSDRNMLQIVASHNMGRDLIGMWLTLHDGIMGHVARTRLPLLVPDYNEWDDRLEHYKALGPITTLAVPLLAGHHLIGVLSVSDTHVGRLFSKDDLRLLSLFAQQATVAIQNGRLFAETERLAMIDPLTGLANRRHFYALAQQVFEQARRYQQDLAAIMLDVDDFKHINDVYGHATGDQVLQEIGQRCRETLRAVDVICRYGGEEVVVLLPDTNQVAACQVAERLRTVLSTASSANGAAITVSIGVAVYQHHDVIDLDGLIDRADRAQYIAKHTGKNRVVVWSNETSIPQTIVS